MKCEFVVRYLRVCRYVYRVCLALSLLCFGLRAWLGDSVDEQGFLHEPFFLVVFGYAFLFIGLAVAIVAMYLRYGRAKR
ncbi:DUF3955 domain-containing protein [Alcaligenaceae bacterium 429]|nr:DUF3955 domain-containing protein [Alcaligenaceae bacterium 429]